MSTRTRLSIPDDVVSREVDGARVLTSLSAGGFTRLDDVGEEIWRAVEEGNSIDQIVTRITARYEVPAEQCRREVEGFLRDLAQRRLIAFDEDAQ